MVPLSAKPKKNLEVIPGEVVEMEGFTVTDSRKLPPPEEWGYTTIPGFEVLSNASTRATQRLMRDFIVFRDALGIVWPIKFRNPLPSAIILCGRNDAFSQFLPANATGERAPLDAGRVSITLINREQGFIVIDLQTKNLDIDPLSMGMDSTENTGLVSFDIDHNEQLYREYVRYLISQSGAALPPWFEEGLCQIIMKMQVEKRAVIFGKVDDPSDYPLPSLRRTSAPIPLMASTDDEDAADSSEAGFLGNNSVDDRDFNIVLRRRALLNFKAFFGVKAGSPVTQNTLGNNIWAKQCYAFVHMCLFRRGGKYKKPFAKFLLRCEKEPPTPEMFKECFGKTFNRVMIDLRGYIDATDYTYQQATLTSGPSFEADPPEIRVASEGVGARIIGDALMVAGKPQEALGVLRAANIRGDQTIPLLSSLGLAAHDAGEPARARKALEAAVAGQTTRSRALTTLARIQLADTQGELDPDRLASVLQLLFDARKLRPALPDTYELIAEAWMRSSTPPKDEHLAVLIEGIRRFPRDVELVYQTAELAARIANYEGARSLVAHGLKITTDAPARERFSRLQSTLPTPDVPAAAQPSAIGPAPANPAAPASAPAS
ncbi:MAG: hypothetical protein LBM92_09205 [Opitutaceae bacterium]|nr:hypothetical protein [Opitutaceae bacterium]